MVDLIATAQAMIKAPVKFGDVVDKSPCTGGLKRAKRMGFTRDSWVTIEDALKTGNERDALFFMECLPDASEQLKVMFDADLVDEYVRSGVLGVEWLDIARGYRRAAWGLEDYPAQRPMLTEEMAHALTDASVARLIHKIRGIASGQYDIFGKSHV